jgi:hypothetical protein
MKQFLEFSFLAVLLAPFAWGDQNAAFLDKVIPSDAVNQGHFGSAVSVWGDLSVVGASNADAVYVYREEHNGSVTKIEKLTAPDGGSNTQFGYSVSMDGGILAVGAKWSDQGGQSNSGAAYLYWIEQNGSAHFLQKLVPSDAVTEDNFGYSVSVSDHFVAVGSPYHDHGGNVDAGSAYLYRVEQNGTVSYLSKVTSSDSNSSDKFGSSVSLSGNLLAVGANDDDHAGGVNAGSAYLFQLEQNGSVTELGKVTASDADANDEFGRSVSLFGDTFAVGAYMHDPDGLNTAGAAYLFRLEQNGSISFLDKVKDAPAGAKLGNSLSMWEDLLIVGAYQETHDGKPDAGAAYLYRVEQNGSATLLDQIVAHDANVSDEFGYAVSLSDGVVAVGAHRTDYWGNTDAGTVFFYDVEPAANRPPVDIRPDPFLGFSPEKEELIHNFQTGWLKAAEDLVFDAYGFTVDSIDDWNVTVHEHGNDPNPLYFLFESGPNDEVDVTYLNFNLPALQPHLDASMGKFLLARETCRMLLMKNSHYEDITGDGVSNGSWFKSGLIDFLVGADDRIVAILGAEPTDSEIDALLAEVGNGETIDTDQRIAAACLAVRYLDFKLRQIGYPQGIGQMTYAMKSQFHSGGGAAGSGINGYFTAMQNAGQLGYANMQAFLNDFKGVNGRDFIQNEVVPKLDNNDTGSVLGSDVTGGSALYWHEVVPDVHGAPQSNVLYEIDEWADVLEFDEDEPIGTVVGRFESDDPDDPQIGWKGYDLIDHGANLSWTDAKAAADAANAADPFHWVYLATVTSEAEHNLTAHLVAQSGVNAWIGANDAAVEGEWHWTEGPEGEEDGGQGLQFWQGGSGGNPVNGLFSNWHSLEPSNNNGFEHYLELRSDKLWGDKANSATPPISAYLLEYDQILTHVYSLVSGYGDDNNNLFSLDPDGTLRTVAAFDYEVHANSYSVRVRATDELNASFEKAFWVDLLDVNEDPDKDGLHNDVDLDDDGDGYSDTEEIAASSNPLSIWSIPPVTKVIRVDHNASGNKDGTSWVDAYDNLQAALAEADGVIRTQIWVAEGVYKPDFGPGQTQNDRNSIFQLKNRLQIIGGFKGHENSESERTDNGWISWLSGDIGAENWPNDNSYHVVNASGVDRTAQLSNFVIAYGRADGPGQWDKRGAGILANNGSPSLHGLAFIRNVAEGSQSGGGGIAVYNGGSPIIYSCLFQANSAEWGGAVKLSEKSSGLFYNVLAYGNQAQKGGAMVVWDSNATVTHSTFSDNNASDGGAFYAGSDSNITFNNTIAWGNTGVANPSASIHSSYVLSHHCVIEGGHGDFTDADPLFVDPLYNDFRLRLGSPFVDAGDLTSVGFLYLDFSNVSRTNDVGPDLGVFEGAVDVVDLGGQVSYSGVIENGPYLVRLIDQFGHTVKEKSMAQPGLFSFVVERGQSYKVKAFHDANADGWPNEDEAWAYNHHSPIQVNASRTDFDVYLSDAPIESNATVSGTIQYQGPVPGPVVVCVFDAQGQLVRDLVLPNGPGPYSLNLPKGAAYDLKAFRDGNGNGLLDAQPEVGEPYAHHGDWNSSTQSHDLIFVEGNLSGVDIEINFHGDHDQDGITDWEEYVAGLTGGGGDPKPPEATNDLIAVYLLDGNASDDSGNNLHGLIHGALPGTNRFGEEGMALFFDGEDDYVQLPSLELGTAYTLSVWVLPEEAKGGGYFNILSNNGDPVWGVREGNLKQYLFGRVEGSLVERHVWTHLVLVRDGVTHTLYKNGELDATANALAGDDVFSVIGAYLPAAGELADREPFHGMIDDLLVWDRAMPIEEVGGLHEMESLSLNRGLIAFYFLDGNESDEFENENQTVVHGAEPGENRFGEEGMALEFDGEDDYVQLQPLELGSEYTLSVWILPDEEKGGGYFNILSNNGDPVWGVREGNLKQYLFGRVEGSPVERHEWTHLVLVRDGETHMLYKDGELDATDNALAGDDVFSVIGAYLPAAGELADREPFHGRIDDLIVWDRALSQDEVVQLHYFETLPPESFEEGEEHDEGEEHGHEEAFKPIVRTGFHEEDEEGYRFSGQILTDGGSPILEVGIFLSESIMGDDLIWLSAQLDEGTLEFSVPVGDLEPGVRYYYQAYARNAVGENIGSLRKLVTREDVHPGAWWSDMPETGGGWRGSGWFGEFRKFEQTDWVYHAKLGWVFVVPHEERGLWLWHRELGWLWTQEGTWPHLWRNEVSAWIYFLKSHEGRPVFYDYGTSDYMILP